VFATQEKRSRAGGFVASLLFRASNFAEELGCEMNVLGGIVTDSFARTTVPGVYAAGDASVVPAQLIIAAAEGSRAAAGVNTDLTESEFL
jgi:thioredoxin reductase